MNSPWNQFTIVSWKNKTLSAWVGIIEFLRKDYKYKNEMFGVFRENKSVIIMQWHWFHERTDFYMPDKSNTVWKSRQKHNHCFYKSTFFSRQIKDLLKRLLKSRFHGNLWAWSRFIVLFHTVSVSNDG